MLLLALLNCPYSGEKKVIGLSGKPCVANPKAIMPRGQVHTYLVST